MRGRVCNLLLLLVLARAVPLGSESRRSCSCGRQSVDQFVWVSGLPLGPLTRFYLALLPSSDNYFILLSNAPSLTRKRICSLQCNHSLVSLLTPNNHTLPSHLRLCSLFAASYDSQGLRWKYSNPPPHGALTNSLNPASSQSHITTVEPKSGTFDHRFFFVLSFLGRPL
jgi:hypothetical protein